MFEDESKGFYLRDKEGVVKANIGEIIVFTADEKNNTFGELKSKEIDAYNQYELTIVVDEAFLKSEDTAYPVKIDPTVEISSSGGIQDVTINSTGGSDGASASLYVGKRATYGVSRALMRFPGLNLSVVPSEGYITNASVLIRDLMCESVAMTVYCHTFTGNAWNESTANWSSVSPNSYVSTALSSKSISYANGSGLSPIHAFSFDITAAVKGWKSGSYAQGKGILFKAASSVETASGNTSKTFGSSERSSYKPVFKMTYMGTITASNLKIYQTKNTYIDDGAGNKPEDIKYNTKTQPELTAMNWISWIDFPRTASARKTTWVNLCETTSTQPLQNVLVGMVDRFMGGTGNEFSNSTLSTKAKEHASTQTYVNAVKTQLHTLLKTYKGDIHKIKYTASNRDSNPLVKKLKDNGIMQPVFNTATDYVQGLKMCVNGLWGNEIVVKSYTSNGTSYSGTLTFTLYDHFGLDTEDINKFGELAGFREWYILQHFTTYGGSYRPFVTKMSFDVNISGTL